MTRPRTMADLVDLFTAGGLAALCGVAEAPGPPPAAQALPTRPAERSPADRAAPGAERAA
jgi:hypothetical protein